MTRRLAVPLILALALVSAACATKTINQVRADPAKYRNQTVTVRGTVAESASIMGKGAYKLTDGDDSLWVVTSGGAPRKGARVDVTGRIEDGYDLGGLGRILKLPEALQNGLVLIESSHKARD
jgi:membrane protein implicated in regulation of membrane protease activity